jgi:hypothetical protein
MWYHHDAWASLSLSHCDHESRSVQPDVVGWPFGDPAVSACHKSLAKNNHDYSPLQVAASKFSLWVRVQVCWAAALGPSPDRLQLEVTVTVMVQSPWLTVQFPGPTGVRWQSDLWHHNEIYILRVSEWIVLTAMLPYTPSLCVITSSANVVAWQLYCDCLIFLACKLEVFLTVTILDSYKIVLHFWFLHSWSCILNFDIEQLY